MSPVSRGEPMYRNVSYAAAAADLQKPEDVANTIAYLKAHP